MHRPELSIFPELLIATSAAATGQSIRLPQSVKRSISSRVLCFGSVDPRASSSSSVERIGLGCSGSGAGALGRFAGAARDALSEGEGKKSVLGVGWLVTDEEVNNGVWQGVAVISSTRDSAVKNSD